MSREVLYSPELKNSLEIVALRNSRNTVLEILNFGAAIFSLNFSNSINVIIAPKNPEDFLLPEYKQHNKCFGASIGRYAGRISNGEISIDGKEHQLFTRDGVHLHGGNFGFAYKLWKIKEVKKGENPSVLLTYFSEDGEEGYPGNLSVSVRYTLTEEDEVLIEYEAITDKETVVNLTNHAYFNLNGAGNIKDHFLRLNSEKVLEVDQKLFPTGTFLDTKGTKMDFSEGKKLGEITLDDVFPLKKDREGEIILKGNHSGISLSIKSNQPAVVVYVPEKLPIDWDYQTEISEEKPSICLETQNFPDAPHHENFPSARLGAGEKYYSFSSWKFEFEK
ncbi:MAG TPA: aldose epimerase family protein [Salinimicrobium sp.]|nr:aldose epimerase family protein [Salinimicrobium sp.]